MLQDNAKEEFEKFLEVEDVIQNLPFEAKPEFFDGEIIEEDVEVRESLHGLCPRCLDTGLLHKYEEKENGGITVLGVLMDKDSGVIKKCGCQDLNVV